MDQKHKIAIITGAGSGIGRAVSQALYNDGWTLVLAGRGEEKLIETAKGMDPTRSILEPTDITDPSQVQSLFANTVKTFGRLDLLFNNAGVSAPAKPLEDIAFDEWQNVINTNLTGAFLCTQEAFRIMKNQQPMGGRIINNGSISAHVPRPLSAPYTASKHAITGLTKSSSLDGREFNIACGQIDIGNAATEMIVQITKGIRQVEGSEKKEPTIELAGIARAVVYMAGLPLDTNVPFITVMANKMPYMGRG